MVLPRRIRFGVCRRIRRKPSCSTSWVEHLNRDQIVDIHGWCIMGNHYHLLVSEIVDGGITKFIMKLNVGYAKYFNARYKRVGTLFQGRITKRSTSIRRILSSHSPLYSSQSSRLFERRRKLANTRNRKSKRRARPLATYRWSDYLDYCGKRIYCRLLQKGLFGDIFKNYGQRLPRT